MGQSHTAETASLRSEAGILGQIIVAEQAQPGAVKREECYGGIIGHGAARKPPGPAHKT